MSVTRRRTVLTLMALAFSVGPVSAQDDWTEASTFGHGGIGLGVATAACWSCDSDSALGFMLGGTVLGMFAGNRIGASAERTAKQGERPNALQLLGARVRTVTGFATLGVGTAGLNANASDRGRDERQLRSARSPAPLGILVEYYRNEDSRLPVSRDRSRSRRSPQPTVASTKRPPRSGARRSIASAARTGRCRTF